MIIGGSRQLVFSGISAGDRVYVRRLRGRWGTLGRALTLSALLPSLSGMCGCTREMYDQPRLDTLEGSVFFSDGKSARRPVPGIVARGELWTENSYFTGEADGRAVSFIPPDPRTSQPFRLTRDVLARGRQRFDIFCSPCHGKTGFGNGMVVRRGFRQPPSLHERRLRDESPPGHFFRVITDGFKTMPAQGSRISPADRWAIVAYLRVLQQSQYVVLDEAPDDVRKRLEQIAPGNP